MRPPPSGPRRGILLTALRRLLRLLEFGASRLVSALADLHQTREVRASLLTIAGALRCAGGTVQAPEAVRLLLHRRFEFLQGLSRSFELEEHLAQQLARGFDGT